MEALVDFWAAPDDLAPFSVIPPATPSVWTTPSDFAVSGQSSQFTPVYEWASTSWNVWSGGAEQAAVGALTVVGSVLEAALQALLALVEREALALLQGATSLVTKALNDAFSSVGRLLDGATNASLLAYEGHGTLGSAGNAWSLFLGPFAIGAGALTALMETVTTILSPFSLGAGFIAGLLITALATTGLGSPGSGPLGLLHQLLSGISSFTSAILISTAETFFETSTGLKTSDFTPLTTVDPSQVQTSLSSADLPTEIGFGLALSAYVTAMVIAIKAGLEAGVAAGIFATVLGLLMAIFTLGFLGNLPRQCDTSDQSQLREFQNAEDGGWILLFFYLGGAIASIIGFGANAILSIVGFVLGLARSVTAYVGLKDLHNACPSA